MEDVINCPYCQAEERGYSESWGMSDEGWEELRRIHLGKHCEKCSLCNQPITGEIDGL